MLTGNPGHLETFDYVGLQRYFLTFCTFKQRFGKSLWQRYGFERVLRNDEPTLGVARYTLENPVRAGLVTCAEEYPFAGSLVYPIAEILAAVQMMPASRKSG